MGQQLVGEHKVVDIKLVHPNTYNPKLSIEESVENRKRYEQIVAGIKEWNMFEDLVVRRMGEEYEIIDGFHRWKACNEIGKTEININDLGVISDDVAKKINILKEEARVPMDIILKVGLLKQLANQNTNIEELARQVGLSHDQLKEDLEVATFDWNQYHDGGVEVEPPKIEEDVTEIKATDEEIKSIQELIAKSMGEESGTDLNIVRLLKIDRIIMTKEQKKIFFQAIEKIMKDNPDIKSKGRAIELICADFLAGV